MKIAILGTRGIPALYGGFETFAEELSIRLAERGNDVTVYCEQASGNQPSTYRGVRLEHVPAVPLGPFTTILFDLRCLWHARKQFDLVYMLGYGTSIFCLLPRFWGTEMWINMDGIEWARSKWGRIAKIWFKIMESAAMFTADRVIADAGAILHHLRCRHYHMPPCSVIPYGAPVIEDAPPVDLLKDMDVAPGRYYLIVCRLEPENCVREIISGFLRSGSALPLVVVGSIQPETDYIRQIVSVRDRRIRFIGSVYNKPLLQALRYYALAYFHGHTVGGTNPSLLEAMGCGNLIIANDNIFNREVGDDVALYFKAMEDIPGLITNIESLREKEKAERKRKAQERILFHYRWEQIAERYDRLFALEEKIRSSRRAVYTSRL